MTNVIPGAVEMKANTAVCLVLCGAALWLLAGNAERGRQRIAQGLCTAVALLAGASLSEYLFDWKLGIDEFLIRDSINANNLFHGRMSPVSAAALLVMAASVALMPHARLRAMSRWGAAAGVAVGGASLLGYLWQAAEIVTDRLMPPMAFNTAASLAFLGGGILLASGKDATLTDGENPAMAAVERKILAGFAIALMLLLAGGSYTYRTNQRFADSVDWVAHTQEVRAGLASLTASLVGAEFELRDFIATADGSHRDEYQRTLKDVEEQLGNLRRLTADNPVQQQNLDQLRPLVSARMSLMADALAAYTADGLPAARTLLSFSRRTASEQGIRDITLRMASLEKSLLDERREEAAAVRRATLGSLVATLGLAVALFTALFGAIHREMRARRDAETALLASEQYNRSIVDNSPDCITLMTVDGQIEKMTPQGRRLFDMDDGMLLADVDWLSLWDADDRKKVRAAIRAAQRGKDGRFQGYCKTLQGTPKWWDVIVMPVLGSDGRPSRLLSVARDISEVKRSQNELLEANRFLDSLIESLPVMIGVKDAASLRFVRVNRAFERLIGYSREELLGRDAHELFPPEQAEFSVLKDREALAQGRMVEVPEQRIHTERLGGRVFHTMKMPVYDAAGRPQFLLAISVDITERKLAETAIHELNAALTARAEELTVTNKELESFSYSVSHDLRAPLRAIDGFAQMLAEDYHERLDAEGRRLLGVIRDNSSRMGELIDDLLAFSRLGRLPLGSAEVDVGSLVREVVAEALEGQAAAPRIEVGPLPPTRGDRGLLRQVWANLISNAIKYSGKVAQPRIEVSGRPDAAENVYWVRDNGVGFNMDYADKLFGVFQRLHRADEFSGTGVGLAIVQRIVSRHGGRVWAEGRVNDGAVFSFALPADCLHG